MIVPSQATVRPRAACPETGESLPLEELVESFCDRHDAGAIEIVGEAGSGKSTALAHLAEVLCTGKAALYLDDANPEDVASARALRLVVYTTARSWPKIADVTFQLSPWVEDDLIEFLLATHLLHRVADLSIFYEITTFVFAHFVNYNDYKSIVKEGNH